MPSTVEEETDLETLVSSSGIDPFLGLTDAVIDGTFLNITGEPLLLAPPWRTGEPTSLAPAEMCTSLITTADSAGWADVVCAGLVLPFPLGTQEPSVFTAALCELPGPGRVDFCGDGIVQPALGEAADEDAECTSVSTAEVAHFYDAANDRLLLGFAAARQFTTAQFVCRSLGGDLVVPDNAQAHEAAVTVVRRLGASGAWIGYHDLTAEALSSAPAFRRADNNLAIGASGFHRFGIGEPSQQAAEAEQDCVELRPQDGGIWNDASCTGNKAFICELP